MAKKKKYEKVTSFTYADEYGNINTHKMTGDTGGYRARDLNQEAPAMAQVSNQTIRPLDTVKDVRTLTLDDASKNLKIADNELKVANDRYQNALSRELKKTGEDYRTRFDDTRDKRISYQTKEEDELPSKPKTIPIQEANKNLQKELNEKQQAYDRWKIANYENNLAEVNAHDVNLWDKTGGRVTSVLSDLGSMFTMGDDRIIKDEEGNKIPLPTKADLMEQKVRQSYGDNLAGQAAKTAGDILHGGTKMLATEGLNLVAPGAGSMLYWADNATDDFINNKSQGYSTEKSLANSAIDTAFQFLSGKALGGLVKQEYGVDADSRLANYLTTQINKVVSKPEVASYLARGGSEAAEEILEEWIGAMNDSLTLGKKFDPVQTFKDSIYAGIVGGGTAGLTNARQLVNANANNQTQAVRPQNLTQTVETQPTSTNIQSEQKTSQMAEKAPITEPQVNQQETIETKNDNLSEKDFNEISRRYKTLLEDTGMDVDFYNENATPEEMLGTIKSIKEMYEDDGFLEQARWEGQEVRQRTRNEYNKIKRFINRFENIVNKEQKATQPNLSEQVTQPTSQIQTQEFRDAQQKIKDGTATEKERTFVKSATEAQNMEYVKEDMDDVAKNYEPMSNEKSLSQAENKLKSFEKLEDKAKFINDMLLSGKRLDASDVAAAELVLKDAAAAKNAKLYSEVLGNISIYATEAGQNIQALSLIKKLSPTSQLDVLEKIINREKAKGNKIYKNIEVTDDMRNRILDCYDSEGNIDQEKFDNTMNEIKQELADDMGVSFSEKVRAWRYLSMLGNPKTHIRNIVANGAMSAVKKVKDTIGSAGQDIFIRDKSQKTATLKWASKDVKNLAKTTANEVYKNETTSKYNEQSDLEGRRQIFKTKTGETLRKGNERLLSKEDTVAKEANFRWAFSNYLTAQGISTEQDIKDNPKIIQKAKEFAIEEANVATFNQRNKLAEYINSADTKFGTVGKVIRGAIIPFTRTPLNIAKTGLEYTPGTGLVTTAMEVKNAPKSQKGRVLIDGLSKQITGSSLALLGYALAKSGIVTAGEDDDKESKFKKDLGNTMKYSIKLPGSDTSVDLSWLSPSSMPFFVGAEMFQTLEKQEGLSEDVILESIASTLDPLSETSVISSFTRILQSYSKKGAQQIGEAGVQTAQNYLSQFIPTVLGQFARVFDDTKRSTYADSDSKNKISQGTYRQLAYKIPGLRNTLPAQTDYYGREKKETENKMLRALDAFVNPANTRKDTMTKEDKELVRLYNKTGNDKIVPSALSYSITYNDKNYPMSQKDYNKYKKDFGDSFRSNVKNLMDSLDYENATDEEKAKMIEGIMDYSKDKTKDNFLTKKGEDYSSTSDKIDDFVGNKMGISDYYALKVSSSVKLGDSETSIVNGQNALKNIALVDAFNMDARDYLTYSYEINKIKADKNSAGKTINGSAKQKKIDYIQSLPLTASQKQMLYSLKVDQTKNKKTNSNVIQAIENADLSAEEKQELYDYIYR